MYEQITLPNGVRLLTEAMSGVRSAAVGIWVGAGSRMERNSEAGSAHFIEHMLFKGTPYRSASKLAADMDAIGQFRVPVDGTFWYADFGGASAIDMDFEENTRLLLQECATEACEWGRDRLEAEEDSLIQGFIDEGMQVDILTEEQLQAFKDAVAELTAELKADYGEDACAAFGIN